MAPAKTNDTPAGISTTATSDSTTKPNLKATLSTSILKTAFNNSEFALASINTFSRDITHVVMETRFTGGYDEIWDGGEESTVTLNVYQMSPEF
ncbi:hypothetical protein BG015_011490 [Linnemannia schmuckeri]|uniref:Uncharacterized protein n=1 Tax=Linnemannia schmuckeri TaxID=64567 RepID=A0A9P5RSY9_9FUNG|nr:hypothetical protein BG015_011490 [Linnemannia schmuckeri]